MRSGSAALPTVELQRCGPIPCDCSEDERAEYAATHPDEAGPGFDGDGTPHTPIQRCSAEDEPVGLQRWKWPWEDDESENTGPGGGGQSGGGGSTDSWDAPETPADAGAPPAAEAPTNQSPAAGPVDAGPPGGVSTPAPGEPQAGIAKKIRAEAICKCVGDDACGGGKIHKKYFYVNNCNTAKKDAEKICNNDPDMIAKCTRPKCYYRHGDYKCPA